MYKFFKFLFLKIGLTLATEPTLDPDSNPNDCHGVLGCITKSKHSPDDSPAIYLSLPTEGPFVLYPTCHET